MNEARSERGHNYVFLGGRVDDQIISGTTNEGNSAFSFFLVFQDSGGRATRIRINAYGCVADVCDDFAKRGVFCLVFGEIMNRLGKYNRLVEVRAREVEFFPEVGNLVGEGSDTG